MLPRRLVFVAVRFQTDRGNVVPFHLFHFQQLQFGTVSFLVHFFRTAVLSQSHFWQPCLGRFYLRKSQFHRTIIIYSSTRSNQGCLDIPGSNVGGRPAWNEVALWQGLIPPTRRDMYPKRAPYRDAIPEAFVYKQKRDRAEQVLQLPADRAKRNLADPA